MALTGPKNLETFWTEIIKLEPASRKSFKTVIASPSTLLRVVSLSNQSPKGTTKFATKHRRIRPVESAASFLADNLKSLRLLHSLRSPATLELPIEFSDEDSSVALTFD